VAEVARFVPQSGHNERTGLKWVALGLLLIAWIGCYFPWTTTTGTAFSVNLFDLAEWTSLDPAVRGENPPFLATFLLRGTVGLIVLSLAIRTSHLSNRKVRWGLWIVALLVGVGLLPPLDFFRGAFDDPNYRQQFLIALVAVVGVGAAVFIGRRGAIGRLAWVASGSLILAFVFGMTGALGGGSALGAFGLVLAPGPGIAVTGVALIGAISLNVLGNVVGLRRNS